MVLFCDHVARNVVWFWGSGKVGPEKKGGEGEIVLLAFELGSHTVAHACNFVRSPASALLLCEDKMFLIQIKVLQGSEILGSPSP